jgi:hypothetical protein
VAAGCACYLVPDDYRQSWAARLRSIPRIEYPARLELGTHELGDQIVRHFTVANRGGGELVVDQIHASCSCTGMEREVDGRYVRVEELRLKAGERADVVLRAAARNAPVGMGTLYVVDFRTNDPAHPDGRIEAPIERLTGGVNTLPEKLLFGSLPPGGVVRHVVEVRDTARPPRTVEKVTTSDPDRVSVRLLPPEGGPADAKPHSLGRVIGRLEVVVNTEHPGEVAAEVRVEASGESRAPTSLRVAGRVLPPFEMTPASLALPRASKDGPIYHANAVCRCGLGKPFTLTPETLPPGLRAEVASGRDPGIQSVRIVWDPQIWKPSAERTCQPVRFRAKAEGLERPLELQVWLQN